MACCRLRKCWNKTWLKNCIIESHHIPIGILSCWSLLPIPLFCFTHSQVSSAFTLVMDHYLRPLALSSINVDSFIYHFFRDVKRRQRHQLSSNVDAMFIGSLSFPSQLPTLAAMEPTRKSHPRNGRPRTPPTRPGGAMTSWRWATYGDPMGTGHRT